MPIIYAETRVTHSTARACDGDDDQRDNQAVFFYQRSRVQHSLAKCRRLYRANDEGSIPCQGYDSDYTIHLRLLRRITCWARDRFCVMTVGLRGRASVAHPFLRPQTRLASVARSSVFVGLACDMVTASHEAQL